MGVLYLYYFALLLMVFRELFTGYKSTYLKGNKKEILGGFIPKRC